MMVQTGKLLRPFQVLRQEGLRVLGIKVLGHLGYRRLLLLERDLASPVAEARTTVPITFDRLTLADLDDYLGLHRHADAVKIRQRFRAGHVCFSARHQGRLVSTCWLAKGNARIDFLNCDLRLATDEAYAFDAFTCPTQRGRNIAPALAAEELRHCRADGLRRVIRGTLPENRPALRAHAKSGFRPYAVMGYLNLCGWRRDFLRPIERLEDVA